jgi:hypothetical protein
VVPDSWFLIPRKKRERTAGHKHHPYNAEYDQPTLARSLALVL